jgi:FkbM family methyltransferase
MLAAMGLSSRIASRLPDRAFVSLLTTLYGRFEPELRRLDDLCPRHGTALDVGAWYGPWSARLARHTERVVSFEPTPRIADILRRTVPPNVEVVQAAASDRIGEAEIWITEGDGPDGINSMSRTGQHNRSLTIPTVTVDSLDLKDVTFAKIDVEGHEVPALRGAEQTIRRDMPRLFVEVETRMQPISGVVDLLAGWGYRGWVLPGRDWVPLEEFDLAGHQERTHTAAVRGLARRVLWPRPRYVNSVLFLPHGTRPGAPAGTAGPDEGTGEADGAR